MKNVRGFLSENFHFFGGKIFSIFELACFRNGHVWSSCNSVIPLDLRTVIFCQKNVLSDL